MGSIVLERNIDPPVRLEDVPAMQQQAAWCLETHRVRHVRSLLSRDGKRMVCLFDAPDAEAVRNVLRTFQQPYEHVWPASIHGPGQIAPLAPLAPQIDAASTLAVVERSFPEPVELGQVQALEERGTWCLREHRVCFLRTHFAADRKRMLCLYVAPDAEAVRIAQEKASLPFERVWAAGVYESHA